MLYEVITHHLHPIEVDYDRLKPLDPIARRGRWSNRLTGPADSAERYRWLVWNDGDPLPREETRESHYDPRTRPRNNFV